MDQSPGYESTKCTLLTEVNLEHRGGSEESQL